MDSTNQGLEGKSSRRQSPRENIKYDSPNIIKDYSGDLTDKLDPTAHMIEDSEAQLKERIAQCKKIIDSLKVELKDEKFKLGKETQPNNNPAENMTKCTSSVETVCPTDMLNTDFAFSPNIFSTCIDSKLNCDENLMEYEKQLQKYQQTLNMAQTEKKNAIRKRMLAKAFKLKLLEIENQCNVELLRVKQSLQCLEPLKIIANKWKSNPESTYDANSFDLIPSYPEFCTNSGSEANFFKNFDMKTLDEENEEYGKNGA